MRTNGSGFPENHFVRQFFRKVADRALGQASLADEDLLLYLSDLLTDFIDCRSVDCLRDAKGDRVIYPTDMMEIAGRLPRSQRKACYQQIGDYTLFMLGMFPESLSRGRRTIPHSYYADTGRRSYVAASELERDISGTVVFRKLAAKYEGCVLTLSWVREYTSDPFYQYMLRQFGIT